MVYLTLNSTGFVSLESLNLENNPELLIENQTMTSVLAMLKYMTITPNMFHLHDSTNLVAAKGLFKQNDIRFFHSIHIDYTPNVLKYEMNDDVFLYCLSFKI